jgi:voltage-gated potassium channel
VSRESSVNKIDRLQIISLVLSIYVLAALIFETLFKVSHDTLELLNKVDFTICFFFLYDFFFRFYKAESKLKFLKWGWIDFISSIPVWNSFQWARLVRVIRILRALRSTKVLINYLYHDKGQGTLITAVLIAILMMIFSSVAVLNFETVPDSNIKSPEDALWWALTTIATVGYGDKYPVTSEGRLTAVLLITCGVGLFGVYTAYIAKLFVAEERNDENSDVKKLTEEIRLLRSEVKAMSLSSQFKETRSLENDDISGRI